MENKTYLRFILILLFIFIISNNKKKYNSQVYSSYEEENFDELRADMNYLSDKIDKICNKLNID